MKECEIAKKEWAGQRYREATFTTIEAVTNYVAKGTNGGGGGDGYDAPWGSNLMSGISKIMGGDNGDAGLLGDQAALDPIVDGKNSPATLWLVIQPGNGGPVEDWVNCEKMSNAQPDTPVVIINGALDKVKGGFYPAFVFPKLAATVDRFYKKFDAGFYLKPFSDKGVYGWLYRVYPEPWQVVYENVKPGKIEGNPGEYLRKLSLLVSCHAYDMMSNFFCNELLWASFYPLTLLEVEYVIVNVLDEKPSYADVISMLVKASQDTR